MNKKVGEMVIRKVLYLSCSVCLIILLASCGWAEMSRNNTNIKKLNIGLSKAEVLAIMGEPLKNEVYNTEDTWYYYTETKWSDGMKTRDECTPVFFKDDKLIGWGSIEYKKFLHKKW